jgi:hypothetical protein
MVRTSITKLAVVRLAIFLLALAGCSTAPPEAGLARYDASLEASKAAVTPLAPPSPVMRAGAPAWPYKVNGVSVGNSPDLVFPTCSSSQALGTVGGGFACVTAGGSSVTWANDLAGSSNTSQTVISAQSGTVNFGMAGQISCASTDTTCEFTQATTSGVTGANSTWAPQTSSSGTNETGGNAIVQLQAPLGSGSEAGLLVKTGAAGSVLMGAYPGGSYDAIWFGNAALSPSSSNYSFLEDVANTTVYLNAPSAINLTVASALAVQIEAGTIAVGPPTIYWNSSVASPTLAYQALSTDVAAGPITIDGQNAYAAAATHLTGGNIVLLSGAGATTNGTPGNVVADVPLPTGTGSEAHLVVERNGTPTVAMGAYVNPAYDAIWFGSAAASPGASNYAFLEDTGGSTTYLAATSALYFNVNGNTMLSAANAGLGFFTAAPVFGGSVNTAYIINASTNPSSACTGGVCAYADSGAFEINPASLGSGAIQFSAITTAASFGVASGSTGSAVGANVTIQGQAETGTASTGGNLILNGASGTSTSGNVTISQAGTNIWRYGVAGAAQVPSTTAITLSTGTVTLTAAQSLVPTQIYSGGLTGAQSVAYPNVAGQWVADISAVTGISTGLVFKSGSASCATISTLTGHMIELIRTSGSNTITCGGMN